MKEADETESTGQGQSPAARQPRAGGEPRWWRVAGWGWLGRHARVVLGVYWVCLVVGTHWPAFQLLPPPPQGPGRNPLYEVLQADKVLHVLGFGGLMVLLILSGLGARGRGWAGRCGVALGIGLVFALLDELTQGLMPGRQMNFADFITNLLVMLGVYLVAVLPAEREPTPAPRGLLVGLLVSLPVLSVLALSPWAMRTAIDLKRSVLGASADRLEALDHVSHGVLSAGLTVLVIVLWPMSSSRPRRAGFFALLVVSSAGPGLEVVQHFTGRSVEGADAVAHAIGVVLAMMWWAARLSWSPTLREPAVPASAPA